jgi:copper chaperone CopZ
LEGFIPGLSGAVISLSKILQQEPKILQGRTAAYTLSLQKKTMVNTYKVTGLTCDACNYKVKHLLGQVPAVENVDISADRTAVNIQVSADLSLPQLQAALKDYPKYQIEEMEVAVEPVLATTRGDMLWCMLTTYKPLLLIFGYILGVSVLLAKNWMDGMHYFMAGFFLVFSFFKFLNLRAFADSYAMYDIVAARFRPWGFIYPFVELGLGLAYLTNFQPILTNWVALVVMSVSIIGVLESVFNRRKIRCACLGTVFNLPMSTVTIIEDALMIAMSGWMLYAMS